MSTQLAARYARALFKLSEESDQVESILKILNILDPLIQRPSRFLHWLVSPQINLEAKRNLFLNVVPEGNKLLRNFFLLLLKKGRLQILPEIICEFKKLAASHLGILDVRLISTIQIDEETRNNLTKKIEETFNKKPIISEEIDPNLIGGEILIIGNKMFDSSLKGKLDRLKKHLLRGST